jgi:hypothetical protein
VGFGSFEPLDSTGYFFPCVCSGIGCPSMMWQCWYLFMFRIMNLSISGASLPWINQVISVLQCVEVWISRTFVDYSIQCIRKENPDKSNFFNELFFKFFIFGFVHN